MQPNIKRLPATETTENPYTVWGNLATQTTEMMTASAQVITHRSVRMAMAGPVPNQRDQEEFSLMGKEKMDALAESAHAMTIRMLSLHQQVAKLALQELMVSTKNLIAFAAGTFLKPVTLGKNKLVTQHVTQSNDVLSQLNASLADVAQIGLQPLHSRATANAKRLGELEKSDYAAAGTAN